VDAFFFARTAKPFIHETTLNGHEFTQMFWFKLNTKSRE
jgi:hypothetical protein